MLPRLLLLSPHYFIVQDQSAHPPAARGTEGWPLPAGTPCPRLQQLPFTKTKLQLKRVASSKVSLGPWPVGSLPPMAVVVEF